MRYDTLQQILKITTNEQKQYLRKVLERVSENSYRRGVEQALLYERNPDLKKKMISKLQTPQGVMDWRLKNRDECIGIDGYNSSIVSRIQTEHLDLWDLFSENA